MAEESRQAPIPRADRPKMPDGYGIPETSEGVLPWSYAEEHLVKARNYWIGTSRPDGRPHAMPVWGVWVDGKLYFDGSPETRRSRNIAANPAVAVHLESGDQVVIVEGEAHETSRPDVALALRLVEAYRSKYAEAGYSPTPEQWDQGGLYVMQPQRGFGWTKFPQDVTRWRF